MITIISNNMKKSTKVYFWSHFQYVGLIKIVGMKNKNELFVYKKSKPNSSICVTNVFVYYTSSQVSTWRELFDYVQKM